MSQGLNRREDLSMRIFVKWRDTKIGVIVAPILAFVMEYPIATLFIAVFAGLSTLPVVLFISFVLYSLLFTILGFAMIEGTFLMIAVCLLSAVIFFVFFVSICITSLLILTWTSAAIGYNWAQKLQWIVHYIFPNLNLSLETPPATAAGHPKSD